MVSDKYSRHCHGKGSLHGRFGGQQGMLRRVCPSNCVDLRCSAALRRGWTPVWQALGAVRPRTTCVGASD